ncbi:hypothetical protein BDN71DRAFT_1442210 [Pleurotus eryngii]|uniref:Uncharacterized protein n=1 Tax=Pleurotus eryngii TaxID=5323 RepID=A0A9P6A3D8_PLEER|nr:hypothetical protein BDN71DRAFT_1442210 [Pleurotus eryngii]
MHIHRRALTTFLQIATGSGSYGEFRITRRMQKNPRRQDHESPRSFFREFGGLTNSP